MQSKVINIIVYKIFGKYLVQNIILYRVSNVRLILSFSYFQK